MAQGLAMTRRRIDPSIIMLIVLSMLIGCASQSTYRGEPDGVMTLEHLLAKWQAKLPDKWRGAYAYDLSNRDAERLREFMTDAINEAITLSPHRPYEDVFAVLVEAYRVRYEDGVNSALGGPRAVTDIEWTLKHAILYPEFEATRRLMSTAERDRDAKRFLIAAGVLAE
ncbi:MAG: hypothetical protein O3A46_14425 [Candidatus Poribacteria bacterium]|nr:hypothetical protein [Candidatus Poribacteria bacterium]